MKPTSATTGLADEQAALWAARLDGSDLSAAERAELGAWLDADPAHRTLLAGYCQFSADLEQQMPLLEGIRDQTAEIRTTPQSALSRPWLRWPLLAGATLAAAAAVVLFLRPDSPATQFESIVTPVAQRQTLALADGSQVELNAHTSLQVALGRDERRVRLASGQAFFAVRAEPARPFIVETPAGAVRVTGTAFDVRAEPAAFEVTVLEGTVQVSPAAASTATVLRPGGQLTADAAGLAVRTLAPEGLDQALAWRRGQVIFTGARLDEALARFARYHGRTLTAAPEAAGLRVGGRYSLDDLDGFFGALEDVLPVQVSRDRNGTVRVGLRPASP